MKDPVAEIARARANMMMRGYEPLRVEVGRQMYAEIKGELDLQSSRYDPPVRPTEVLGMPLITRDDMEGFAVLHDPGN